MPLSFTRKTWKNRADGAQQGIDPALSAVELDRIEQGIDDVVNEILALEAAGGSGGGASVGTGAPSSLALGATYFELNGSGQVVAIWLGTSTTPTKVMDVLTSGVITPLGVWSNVTAYGVDSVVTRSGSSYISVVGSTGIDPATDDGSHWMLLAQKGDTGPQGNPGSGVGDGQILNRYFNPLSRSAGGFGFMIGSGFSQNYARTEAQSAVTTATRQLLSSGGMVLPGGVAVSALRMFSSSTALASPVHQFVALYDARTRNLLAAGTDVTTQAWAANSSAVFPISYTPANDAEVLAVYYVEATTPPSLAGKGSATPAATDPRFGGLHDTLAAGSVPANLPATMAVAGSAKGPFWVQAE